MKTITRRLAAALLAGVLAVTVLAGCSSGGYSERQEQQQQTTLDNSLEEQNLRAKLEREEDATAQRYVYLMNFGQIVGYYTITGKVSSSGSQIAPEQDVVCRYNTSESCQAVDSAQDDGTYGAGDPGIFFFTTDGVLVETSLDYVVSDAPLAIDVPRLEAE